MAAINRSDIYKPLSTEVFGQTSKLTSQPNPNQNDTPEESGTSTEDLFLSLLPKSCHHEFKEFETAYVDLNSIQKPWMHKFKRRLQKNAINGKIQIKPRKDKGSLTSKERREFGLHKVNKFDKTFKMFLPINSMWKKYAKKYIGIQRHKKNGWKGEENDSVTVTVQNFVRKMEYFGCFIRVTKSKCSEYIGIVGIVIRETKNAFMLIGPDDKVRTIPKMHSEFSFVVDGVGFSILGNHLNQKSSVRAKHTYKKHCLWL